jgi:hypothetical protein
MLDSTTLSNNPSPFAMIAPENILDYAKAAISTMESNEKSNGKAQQKLCACVIMQHERDTETPPPVTVLPLGVPALVTMTGDAKIAVQYRKYIGSYFVGSFDTNGKYADEDAKTRAKKAWSKRNTILQNAIKLAVALMSASGGVVCYDHKSSMFSVHPAMLLPKDCEAIGQLARKVHDGVNVPLDHQSWRYESANPRKETTVQASIAQVVRAHDSRIGKPAKVKATTPGTTPDEAASTASGPKIDTHDMTFGRHIRAAAKIVTDGGALTRDMLDNDEWNALVAIVAQFDAIQGEPMQMHIAA